MARLSAALILFLMASCSLAQSVATWTGKVQDVDAWITVVAHEPVPPPAERSTRPWWTWGNATSDAYLFAFRDETDVSLVVSFASEGSTTSASIYVSRSFDSPIPYRVTENGLVVDRPPDVELLTSGGGWLVGDATNYELTMHIDGLGERHPLVQASVLPPGPDGRVDRIREVGGSPGLPEWETEVLVTDERPDWGYIRFFALERMESAPPFRVAEPMMPTFPFLGAGTSSANWLVENPPPIYFVVDERTIRFHNFVGFQTGGHYYVSSIALPPQVNFESPFAFYNFDSTTRAAHLVVRAGVFPHGTPWGSRPIGQTRTTFRYSWKTNSHVRWRYGIHVAGFHELDEEITIGDTSFMAISAERLPAWITENPWPLVTFVEAVNGYAGSEGIYFYSAQALDHWPWLSGERSEPSPFLESPYVPTNRLLTKYSDVSLPPGFRGEYSATYFRAPTLYLSPVDRAVHLLGAEGGVWNLGGGRVLRTRDADGDGYADTWRREIVPPRRDGDPQPETLAQARPGEAEEQLIAFDDYLLYAGNDELLLYASPHDAVPQSLVPPSDEGSWRRFREQTAGSALAPRNPRNLRTWLPDGQDPLVHLDAASLEGVSMAEGVVRLEITLSAARIDGPTPMIEVFQDLAPGRHYLIYDGDIAGWRARPGDGGSLTAEVAAAVPQLYLPQEIEVRLTNVGIGPWRGPVSLSIGTETLILWEDLWLPTGASASTSAEWTPQQPGAMSRTVHAGDRPLLTDDVSVPPPYRPFGVQALDLSIEGDVGIVVLILAIALVAIVGSLVVVGRRM